MGINKFVGSIIVPHFEAIMKAKLPPNIDWLELDMNALLHNIAGQVWVYGEFRKDLERQRKFDEIKRREAEVAAKTDQQLEQDFYKALDRYILKLVDQVAPRKGLVIALDALAPVAKQNQQRQRRIRSAAARQVSEVPGERRFDGANQFTPGTDFMRRINAHLREFFGRERAKLPQTLVYMSHLSRGEGEHQLLRYTKRKIPENDVVLMVGADADLMMLGLRLKHPFYIVRGNLDEEFRYNKQTNRREPAKKIFDVNEFRKRIAAADVGVNEFVFTMFLLGNDFLPPQPGFDDISVSFPIMWEALKGRRFFNGTALDVPKWLELVQAIHGHQGKLVEGVAKQALAYPFALAQAALVPAGGGITENSTLDFNRFRHLWYQRMFRTDVIKYTPEQLNEAINGAAIEYFTTMIWVAQYYVDHLSVSWTWAYPQLFAPLLVDLQTINVTYPITPVPYKLNPIGQLLAVIPKLAKSLVPEFAQAAYQDNSPISDMYPIKVVTMVEGKSEKDSHISFTYLPVIDINRVIAVQDRLPATRAQLDDYAEEPMFTNERAVPIAAPAAPIKVPAVPINIPLAVAPPKLDIGFESESNMRLLAKMYGYAMTREIFPPSRTRRFYPSQVSANVAPYAFPVLPIKVRVPVAVVAPPAPPAGVEDLTGALAAMTVTSTPQEFEQPEY
jgi:5'-3' exoribonuclease 1